MQNLPGGLELRFHPDEEDFPTWYRAEDRGSENEYPCFFNKGRHRFADDVVYRCIGYQFYFQYNRAIGLGGAFPWSEPLGYHRHDVEGIYLLFDTETKEPRHVYFKAHGLGQGVWMTWDECQKTEDGALVVYFSWRSHATYPRSGDIGRIFGLANDRVADGGRTVRITNKNCVPAPNEDFGDGIRIYKGIPRISNESISDRERLHLPLVQDEIRERANAQYD